MPRSKPLQTNFAAGELSPDLGMRQDTGQYANGAKSLRNRRCMIGGGTKRRPGSARLIELAQTGRVEPFVVNQQTRYLLVFSAGRVDAYLQDILTGNLTAAGSLTQATSGNDTFTKVLLTYDDQADGSTTITDSNAGGSAHVWTAQGNAQIDTAIFKFGGALLCDGAGDWVQTPAHVDFSLGSSDFARETWFNCTAPAGTSRGLMGQCDAALTPALSSFRIYRDPATSFLVAEVYQGANTFTLTSGSQFTNVDNPGFNHVRLVRTKNALKLFINGTQQFSDVSFTGSVNDSAAVVTVGADRAGGANSWLGSIDDTRFSLGVARSTTAFVPLTVSFGVPVPVPWTGTIWSEMDYEQAANTAFLTHRSMPPQRLVRTGPSTWALSEFAFFNGPGGRLEQPYFRAADPQITLTPGPGTQIVNAAAAVTVLASLPYFTAAYIGKRIRIFGRELVIIGFTDSTHVSAIIVEQLRYTLRLTFAAAATGFAVGDAVQGVTSGTKGIITGIIDSTHIDVTLTNSQTFFDPAEVLVGPNDKVTLSARVQTNNAATDQWDEQLFSSILGYPAAVALHRNRLLFGGHPAVPNALIGSKLENLYSFFLGDQSDGDAIFETIGDAGASTIVQLHSAEQLLVLTDHGPYYVPEGATNPFRPGSIAFFPFGTPWSITQTAKARGFDDGVLFVSGSLVIKARPTGNQNQLWSADDDVSLIAAHLLNQPYRLAVVSNFDGRAERYALMINADGTLAIMQLVEAQKVRNLTPWDTLGDYNSVAAIASDLYVTVERVIDGTTRHFLEHFRQTLTLDCAKEYADLAALNAGVPVDFGASEVHVTTGSGLTALYLGTWPLVSTTPPPGPYTAGLYYDSEIETLPPVMQDQEGSAAGDLMRICEALVHVVGSQRFALNGYTIAAYQVTDDVGLPPPVRNGPIKFEPLGWKREPTLIINQPDPLPLDILAIKSTVAF